MRKKLVRIWNTIIYAYIVLAMTGDMQCMHICFLLKEKVDSISCLDIDMFELCHCFGKLLFYFSSYIRPSCGLITWVGIRPLCGFYKFFILVCIRPFYGRSKFWILVCIRPFYRLSKFLDNSLYPPILWT